MDANFPVTDYTDYTDYIMLVDDEPHILLSFSVMLKSSGFNHVVTIQDSRQVIPFLREHPVTLVVLDLAMPFVTGQDVLVEIQIEFPQIPVIIITATNEIDTAVECMRYGAVDYLMKPVEKERFLSSIRRVLELRHLKKEVSTLSKYILSDELVHPEHFTDIITKSKKMFAIFKYIEAISDSLHPVLITGETGVGKELIAHALHRASGAIGEFVAVNAAGVDDSVFSDTLFGHKKGAFTDAATARDGFIARSARGTLFLDEIGDLCLASQVKLLRLIQEHEYYPLGSDIPKKTDARIIVSTNCNLEELMVRQQFRKDLYFRLCSHHIHLPPLRERTEDIPVLLDYFMAGAAQALNKTPPLMPEQLVLMLQDYSFPGNVRQLQSLVHDAMSLYTEGPLPLSPFEKILPTGPMVRESNGDHSAAPRQHGNLEDIFGRFPTLKDMERYLTDEALKRAAGNQGLAATLLGITRQALNKRLKRKKEA